MAKKIEFEVLEERGDLRRVKTKHGETWLDADNNAVAAPSEPEPAKPAKTEKKKAEPDAAPVVS